MNRSPPGPSSAPSDCDGLSPWSGPGHTIPLILDHHDRVSPSLLSNASESVSSRRSVSEYSLSVLDCTDNVLNYRSRASQIMGKPHRSLQSLPFRPRNRTAGAEFLRKCTPRETWTKLSYHLKRSSLASRASVVSRCKTRLVKFSRAWTVETIPSLKMRAVPSRAGYWCAHANLTPTKCPSQAPSATSQFPGYPTNIPCNQVRILCGSLSVHRLTCF